MLEQDQNDIQENEKQNTSPEDSNRLSLQKAQAYQVQIVSMENSKFVSAMAYLPMAWIAGLLLFPKDSKVKFHVNQGVSLTIFIAGLYWVISLVSEIFLTFMPMFVAVSTLLHSLASVASLIYIAIGIAHVYTETEQPLPIIGCYIKLIR